MKNLRPGTVIAAIALFIVIGGSATAASGLINGKQIKRGTVTAKQIKNKTITRAKLAPSTVKSLKGSRGARGPAGTRGAIGPAGVPGAIGPAGAPGVPGATGAAGPAGSSGPTGPAGVAGATGPTGPGGIVQPLSTELITFHLFRDNHATPLAIDVPAGQYLISAKLNLISHHNVGTNMIDCTVWTDETHGVDRARADATFNEYLNLSMLAVAEVEELIELRCVAWDGDAQASDLKLVAQPVQG